MNIYMFSNGEEVNLDQITTVKKDEEKNTAFLHMSDGNTVTVALSEYQFAKKMASESKEKGITKADIRNLIDTMNRLSNSIPHSVRVHL